ncbi:hypothetical protein MWH25_04200 [Natroniella acetigena]|uniref:hypothetical protein n=1 Tax=Natroniella acetigena TaxID=52004 RepID=UPI00200B7A41|nr:hypothetical protein [Natroniella acetigena]MCK8826950.1 hypothetical protein [Natroniella acetigena]
MGKKELSLIEQEQKLLELESLYYQQPNTELVPTELYHFIKEEQPKLITEALNKIKQEGLKVARPRNTTKFIDQKVQRPVGIYFWSQPILEEVYITVDINRLNPTKLYAFPHLIADTILEIKKKYIVNHQFWAKLKEIAYTIPFAEYQGQFRAEFIYTADIPAKLLTIDQT